MSQESNNSEKRVIIDEDWKAKVQAEKEKPAATEKADGPRQRPPLPPANISFLFSTLATQAFVSLGLVPNPMTEKTETDLDQAQHFIDMLGVLEEKTKGNLTTEEKKQLDAILFDLRMAFVEATSKKPT